MPQPGSPAPRRGVLWKEVSEADPWGAALLWLLSRLLCFHGSETRGCFQKKHGKEWIQFRAALRRSSKRVGSRASSTWLTVGSWTSHFHPRTPEMPAGRRHRSLTTLGLSCSQLFSEACGPLHGWNWRWWESAITCRRPGSAGRRAGFLSLVRGRGSLKRQLLDPDTTVQQG